MRRKISLYISDQLVDLDDQSFILFNYTMDDLSNPTIVKNSFSQQIRLKGTPANNRIFGSAFKTDRRVGNTGGDTGVDFNPSQKTPFTIYNEMNEILETGYVKLDSVSKTREDVEYKVTLYGGLGSFFYALSYDENGNKRNLADLIYLETGSPETELDFVINAASVQAAWARLRNHTSTPSMWDIINFAPAYNGIPDGNFSPDKALVLPSDVGLQDTIVVGDETAQSTWGSWNLGGNPARAFAIADTMAMEGGVVSVKLSSYSTYKVTLAIQTGTAWDSTKISDTGWMSSDVQKTITSAEDGYYIRVAIGRVDNQPITLTEFLSAISEMTYTYPSGERYTIKSGYGLVNLAEAQDEWAVKDLRSYLQRPVFSMKAFWEAICNPDNNGGYEVDASVILNSATFGKYSNLWMTLPMITSIGSIQQESGDLTLTRSSTASSGNLIGRYDISGSVPAGTKVTANLNCKIRFNVPSGANAYSTLYRSVQQSAGQIINGKFSVIFIQAVAYGSDNTIVGGSKVKVIGAPGRAGGASTAAACGYTPTWAADYENVSANTFSKVSAGVWEFPSEMSFSVVAQDVAYYKILMSVYSGTSYTSGGGSGSTTRYTYSGNGTSSVPVLYVDYSVGYTATSTFIAAGDTSDTITYTSSESLRSGATITKSMLLSSSHTPAEYMLSFCKIFGLYFLYDNATRKVTILRRDDLYQDETIDLTRRVDLSKGYSIQPLVFNAKWYDFVLAGVGGAFYDEYLNVEGLQYGIQRVNTGYDFNAEAVDLLSSVVFKNACTILGRSKYFNYIFKSGGIFQPSPFLDKGNTYVLWSADGETLETDISCPPSSANVTYYNTNAAYKGYDINTARKLELRTADNKPVDGADILVFLEGWDQYDYFKLTDDVPAMDILNDGVPCWLLGAGDSGQDALNVPSFQRYSYQSAAIVDSLDFGIPRQMNIPGVTITDGCTIYDRGWKAYLSDRYDVNTKVITCRVNFAGMQVGQDLLRKFYWFDNSLWVLNKIKNYSLTTYDPVECEFVQVQDKNNYLTGQDY